MRAMRDSETPGEEFRVAAAGPAVTLLLTRRSSAPSASRCSATCCSTPRRSQLASGSTARGAARASPRSPTPACSSSTWSPRSRSTAAGSRAPSPGRLSGDRHKAHALRRLPRPGLRGADDRLRRLPLRRRGDATDGLWWIVLGWMLGGSARAAVAAERFADRLDGVTAGDIMDAEPVTIPAELAVERAYDEYFLRYQGWPWFAVVEADGHFAGLAHRAAVEHAALDENPALPVRDVVADVRARPDRHAAGVADRLRAAARARRADGGRRRRPPARRGDASSRSRRALQATLGA